MNVVLHIVRKDLLRLRWWLVAWAGVVALPVLLGAAVLAGVSPDREASNLTHGYHVLLALEGLLAYVLTLVLIQEDGPVGTRQFWLTRPIGRGRLVAAKAFGALVVLGFVPIAISLPWWWWCGFGVGEITVAALEWCAVAALVALPAALVAVLTDSLGRALLWTTVALTAVPVAAFYYGAVLSEGVVDQPSRALWISRSALAVGLVAVEFAVLIVAQYYLRRRGGWLVAAGAMVFATLGLASRWPWLLIGRVAPREVNAERAAGVKVQLQRAWAARPASGAANVGRGIGKVKQVQTQFGVSGVPAGMMLTGLGAEQRWLFGDAFGLKRSDYLSGWSARGVQIAGLRERRWSAYSDDEETRRWVAEWWERRKRRPLQPALPDDQAELRSQAFFQPSLVARMLTDPPSYDARLWLKLVRLELGIEAPFAPGRWHTNRGHGIRIESVDFTHGPRNDMKPGGGALVDLVECRPASIVGMLREWAEKGGWFDRADSLVGRFGYVVLNRGRGEFISLWSMDESSSRELVVHGVRVLRRRMGVDAPHIVRAGEWAPVAGWMSGATIGAVVLGEETVFARDVKTERFELSADPGP